MKKLSKILFILVLTILVTGCGNKSYLKEVDYDEYQKMLRNKETFTIEIMRTNCSACQNFKPKLEQVTKEYKVKVYYIDTDKLDDETKDEIYNTTGISGTPTVIFYNKGKEVSKYSRINGSVSTDKIISKFKANGLIKE